MRQAFNVGVVVILALLLANRAVTRIEAHEGKLTCAKASLLVKAEALARGFSQMGARSQSENFLSSCLVSGEGQVGDVTAHD